jgi:hypothetical protein
LHREAERIDQHLARLWLLLTAHRSDSILFLGFVGTQRESNTASNSQDDGEQEGFHGPAAPGAIVPLSLVPRCRTCRPAPECLVKATAEAIAGNSRHWL